DAPVAGEIGDEVQLRLQLPGDLGKRQAALFLKLRLQLLGVPLKASALDEARPPLASVFAVVVVLGKRRNLVAEGLNVFRDEGVDPLLSAAPEVSGPAEHLALLVDQDASARGVLGAEFQKPVAELKQWGHGAVDEALHPEELPAAHHLTDDASLDHVESARASQLGTSLPVGVLLGEVPRPQVGVDEPHSVARRVAVSELVKLPH